MIHIIFELKHHNTDTQQKSSTLVMHPLNKYIFNEAITQSYKYNKYAESHVTFIL